MKYFFFLIFIHRNVKMEFFLKKRNCYNNWENNSESWDRCIFECSRNERLSDWSRAIVWLILDDFNSQNLLSKFFWRQFTNESAGRYNVDELNAVDISTRSSLKKLTGRRQKLRGSAPGVRRARAVSSDGPVVTNERTSSNTSKTHWSILNPHVRRAIRVTGQIDHVLKAGVSDDSLKLSEKKKKKIKKLENMK